MLSFSIQLLIAAVCGLVAHWAYFIHREIDLKAARIAAGHLAASVLIFSEKWVLEGIVAEKAFQNSTCIIVAYLVALFASITSFRLLFSPLQHVPGPLGLSLTKFTHVWCMAKYQNSLFLHDLSLKYGNVVRTGPNEVTLFGTDAYYQLHGPDSKCGRAQYYDLLHPMVSLDTTREPSVHAYRRKVWDQAFSIRALDQAETIVYENADQLVKRLRDMNGEPVNITDWLEYYSFDTMGKFGLSIDFKNLTKGEHPIMKLYHIAHRRLGPFGAAPWIKHLMMGIPYIERMKYYRMFMNWAHEELDRNIEIFSKPGQRNLMGYLVDDAKAHGGMKANWNFLLGDFVLVIVAGSDPVRQVITNLLYYLIRHPEHLKKVHAELHSSDIRNHRTLVKLVHFNACIHETIRLNPPVPSAGLRMSPAGGITINDTFIPEGTTVVAPQYSLMRDERNFQNATEWIPERFSTKPELIHDKRAYVPWTTGKYACLGKNLSLMEIRVASALLLTTFDINFAPGEKGVKMFTEACDYFTTTPGPLLLTLKEGKVPNL